MLFLWGCLLFWHYGCGGSISLSVERKRSMPSPTNTVDSDVYDLESATAEGIPSEWQSTSSYTLDSAVCCPHCQERITSVRIIGLTRSQVAFTSTLPRKGRVIVCPECERILTVELSGLV